jgi:hypothetical protein
MNGDLEDMDDLIEEFEEEEFDEDRRKKLEHGK